ncbi:MAG: carboxy terminal-processing peptidase [Halobacteriovoraceae bacterium]|nr:carboxy terminal-processing peptidase [Halobacteriovoraceae bacterium]
MRKLFLPILLVLGVFYSQALFSQAPMSSSKSSKVVNESEIDKSFERLISNLIRDRLKRYHYEDKTLDDGLSEKAFTEFVKRFDYGKQFFLASDIKALEKYKFKIDDQMSKEEPKLLNATIAIYNKRIRQLDKYRKEIFKKPFSFTKKEYLELDPEKRKAFKNEKSLKNHWRKVYKQAVLSKYIALMEAQKDLEEGKKDKKSKKDKKGKKKKEEKILTDKEMRKKAHDSINEKYQKFYSRLKKDKRMDHLQKFYNAVASVYDPHTVYFPPKAKEDFDIDISGQLEGIGAVLQEDGAYIKVVRIVPGGAAWRQKGLEVDDIILYAAEGEADPTDLVNMRVDDAVRYIRGKKGTEVRLTVKKADGSRKVIPITRDVVQIEASYAKGSVIKHKDLGIKIGYIYVPKFYRDFNNPDRSCTADVLMEIKRLKKQNIDGLILDLRNNGGGALEDAREMSGLFIDKGPIVQIRSRQTRFETLKDDDETIHYGGPLVVMVNRFSASASEILAGAMQDYKRAVIVGGEYTHGKGTVQAILDLSRSPMMNFLNKSLGAIKLTVQKFYRITGNSTQFKGVTPDIILPDPNGYADNREQDLDYAIPWDSVEKLPYSEWSKQYSQWKGSKFTSYQIPKLKERSSIRVGKNEKFQKIKKSVEYLRKRKKDTKVSLNLSEVLKEDEKNKKVTESFKIEDTENKNILVSNFEESLMAHENVREADKERWRKDFEQRKEDWVKTLTGDPMIEETLFIMDDIVRQSKGKKLSMVKK